MKDVLDRLAALAGSKADRASRAREAAECVRAARNFRWVGLYDVTPSRIVAIAWTGAVPPAFPAFPRTRGLNGAAVSANAPVVVQDVRGDARYLTTFGSTRAEAVFPVRAGSEVVGTIDVESDRANSFTPEDERFLEACAAALSGLWSGR